MVVVAAAAGSKANRNKPSGVATEGNAMDPESSDHVPTVFHGQIPLSRDLLMNLVFTIVSCQ
jgi:hypothetical protein